MSGFNLNLEIKQMTENIKGLEKDLEMLKKGELCFGVCIIRHYIKYNELDKIVNTTSVYDFIEGDCEAYLEELVDDFFIEGENGKFKKDTSVRVRQVSKEDWKIELKGLIEENISKSKSILTYLKDELNKKEMKK